MLIIILIAIIIYLGSRLFLYKKDMEIFQDEMEYIRENQLNNRKVEGLNTRDMKELSGYYNDLLEERQKLEIQYKKKEDSIKDIIVSISHDLRTPLTSIKGYTNILSEDMESQEDQKYLDIINSRIDALENLISSFYELSKLDVDEYRSKLEYVDLKELLLEVVLDHYERFNEKGIEPNIDIVEDEILVIGDRKSIERVFINLVDNGIKYSTGRMDIILRKDRGRIINIFRNSAQGLDEEKSKKIFEKFYILDTSRQGDSTGLGLYITRKLIINMGYNISTSYSQGEIDFILDWNDKIGGSNNGLKED